MAAADRSSLRLVAALALVSSAGSRAPALAQNEATNRSLAETLFQDARRLMADKKYADACPKLAESQRLDPATGTLLNLAVCHAEQGKLASAWLEFTEAQAAARRDGRPDREQFAREHLVAIEPRISHLTIVVPEAARLPGLQIKEDGGVVGAAAWGLATPVDPGVHEVSATASDRRTWTRSFTITGDAQNQMIEVPVLGFVASPPAAVAAATGPDRVGPPPIAPVQVSERPARAPAAPGLRTASYVVAGAGVVALGTGVIFGARAFSKWSDRNKNCPNGACNDAAVADGNAASTAALVSDITVGLGLAAVVTSAVLWYRSRPADAATAAAANGPSVSLAPLGARGGALIVDGRW